MVAEIETVVVQKKKISLSTEKKNHKLALNLLVGVFTLQAKLWPKYSQNSGMQHFFKISSKFWQNAVWRRDFSPREAIVVSALREILFGRPKRTQLMQLIDTY